MLATSPFLNQTIHQNGSSSSSSVVTSSSSSSSIIASNSQVQTLMVLDQQAQLPVNKLTSPDLDSGCGNDGIVNGCVEAIKADDDDSNNNNQVGGPEDSVVESGGHEDEVEITISNVVTNFNVKCHLNLRYIATNGSNVVYRREQSIILMKLRQPSVTASIWSSGKITCTGATTEIQAKQASKRVARQLQRLGFRVKFTAYRIVNVMGNCRLPFGIKIAEFSTENRRKASYEPELHPGVTYRIEELKAVLKIFQTGAITILAPSISNVQLAVEHIYPLVYEFRKPKPPSNEKIVPAGANKLNVYNVISNSSLFPPSDPLEVFGDDGNDDDVEIDVDVHPDDPKLLVSMKPHAASSTASTSSESLGFVSKKRKLTSSTHVSFSRDEDLFSESDPDNSDSD